MGETLTTETEVGGDLLSLGLSLWLVPAQAQMDALKACLPTRPPTATLSPSSYPAIVPHVTLATVPLSDSTIPGVLLDAVPGDQEAIHVRFQSLVVGDHYFRSVFVDVQPTRELVAFQRQILASLRRRGLDPSAPRFPHMSLCYIADEDASERDRMARLWRDTGVVSQTADPRSIALRCGDASLTAFSGEEVWLVKCEGPMETWEIDERKIAFIPES